MSVAAPALRPRPSPLGATLRRAEAERGPPGLAVVAFVAFSALAGIRFAALLTHPPTWSVLGVVAVAAAGGCALSWTARLGPHPLLAGPLRLLVVTLMAYFALRAAGTPQRLLRPWEWGSLGEELRRGLDGLTGSWPYAGGLRAARTVLTLAVPIAVIPAAALTFWPGPRRAIKRRVLAFGLLLGLYLLGSVNQPQAGWRVQGLLLLCLTVLWIYGWGGSQQLGARAVAWLILGAVIGLLGAGVLSSPTPVLDYRGWNPFAPPFPATSFNWNQVYGPLPWTDTAETMVSISSSAPHLWRATTLDRFDGFRFLRSRSQPADAGLGGIRLKPRWISRTTVTVRGLDSNLLLSAGSVTGSQLAGAAATRTRLLAADGTVSVSGPPLGSGARYTVSAYAPEPTVGEMRRAPDTEPATLAPYTQFELPGAGGAPVLISTTTGQDVTRIEHTAYGRVYRLARALAAGAGTRYDIAARIESFLRHDFVYDTRPGRTRFPLVSFLFQSRRGYCQQFSGAMTLLLRMDGVPARVAAGFLVGSRAAFTDSYEVSAHDAHAWVEVFFAGIGWVPFDPTPSATGPGPSAISLAKLTTGNQAAGESSSAPIQTRKRSSRRPVSGARRATAGFDVAPLAYAALAVALALLAGASLTLARARRAYGANTDGALRELLVVLGSAGIEVRPAVTLSELAHELELSHGPAAAGYVRLLRERRYAAVPEQALPGPTDRRELRRELCARRGPLVRLRAWVCLPPWSPRDAPRER